MLQKTHTLHIFLIQLLLLNISFLIIGCREMSESYRKKEHEKIVRCSENWEYLDLQKDTIVQVLHFYPEMHFDISYYPNFVIGVYPGTNDTCGFMDKEFDGEIRQGSIIHLSSVYWSTAEKYFRPPFIISKDPGINNLNCSVKQVYYCRIDSVAK